MSTTTMERSGISAQNSQREYLTIHIANQIFGIPVLQVQDVLGEQRVTRVPLSPPAVAGSLNLRGRIVTAINVRICLGLPLAQETGAHPMSVVVENQNELYSLMIDKVGDVLSLPESDFEQTPATLDPHWRSVARGIYRLQGRLLVVLDVPSLLEGITR